MQSNPFHEKNMVPGEDDLHEVLGKSYALLQQLRSSIANAVGATREEWKYYGKKNGWLLKTLYNKRNLFFLQAGVDFFVASFVFGDKAIECIRQSGISPGYIDALEKSQKYAEGRGITVRIESPGALRDVLKLLRCKIDH
jgi:hypothetical protein